MSGSQVVPRCTVGLAAGGSGGRTDTGGRTQLDMSESIAENSEAHRASAERGERSERGVMLRKGDTLKADNEKNSET